MLSSRALRGARGLKLKPDGAIFDRYGSRPSRGAWIETPPEALPLSVVVGRALRGARGLKQEAAGQSVLVAYVAPFAGRVD